MYHLSHLYVYVHQLKDAESAKNPRQLLAQGRGAGLSISEEEKSTLEKDIKEQEVLLLGYQKVCQRERVGGQRGVLTVKVKVVTLENWSLHHKGKFLSESTHLIVLPNSIFGRGLNKQHIACDKGVIT